jgi:hypothetical protein
MNDGRREDDKGWMGEERRSHLALTEDQINAIAERAAAKVIMNFQLQVGRGVLNKLAWLVGAVAVGIGLWLSANGFIKLK